MASETSPLPEARPGLPPVEPPSGRLIGRLFIMPAVIVAGVVAIVLFFNWLVSGPRSAESFLRKLDEPNPEVRWRAAADLAQVLLRDDRLASDPAFALALTVRLDRARGDLAAGEAAAARPGGSPALSEVAGEDAAEPRDAGPGRDRSRREQERNYVHFLAACLGNVVVPVGAPVLQELAVDAKGPDPRAVAERRRAALWALANLGENLKRFDRLSTAQQEAILAVLGEPRADRDQAAWSKTARHHLAARVSGTPDAMGMDRTIATCAAAAEPFLRELAAFAANFWKGDAAGEARIDQALVRLSRDDGHGEELLEEWSRNERTRTVAAGTPVLTTVPGLKVRMNAAIALARRGSVHARPDVLAEMLDEGRLQKAFVVREPDGRERPDEGFVLNTITSTLRTVVELHRQRPGLAMPEVRAAVDRLAGHENAAVSAEARKTQLAFDK